MYQSSSTTNGLIPTGDKTYNIFVGDLYSDVSQDEIMEAFKTCGQIVKVRINVDKFTKERAFAFVFFTTLQARDTAVERANTSRILVRVKINLQNHL